MVVVVAVQLPNVTDVEFDASITDLRQLAKTLGFQVVRTFTQKRPRFDPTAYLGEGKRDEIRRFIGKEPAEDEGSLDDIKADESPDRSAEHSRADSPSNAADTAASEPIEAVFVDHEISPSQARNLEKEVGCAVSDRGGGSVRNSRRSRSSATRTRASPR